MIPPSIKGNLNNTLTIGKQDGRRTVSPLEFNHETSILDMSIHNQIVDLEQGKHS